MRRVNRKYGRTAHNRPMKRNKINESIRNKSRSRRVGESVRNRSYRRRINEDVGDIVAFSELNSAQKQYVLDNWNFMDSLADTLNGWFSEDSMSLYEDMLNEIASRYEKLGVYINTDKIYWQSNSQGSYYSDCWLSEVVDGVSFDNRSDGECIEVSFPNHYGSPYPGNAKDVAEIGYYGVDEYGDEDYIVINYGDLKGDTYIDEYTKRQISDFIDKVEDALSDIWNLIRDTCMAYPEDEWVEDMLDNNSGFRFEIIDDKRVEAV